MAICPECGSKIDHLVLYEQFQKKLKFSVDEDGSIRKISKDFFYCDDSDEYECPECSVVIAESLEDATTFLKGE